MKVVDVSFSYDEHTATVDELLAKHYTVTGWAEALQQKGIEIAVLKRFSVGSSFLKNNVSYHLIKDPFDGNLKAWQLPFKLLRAIKKLNADVVHIHGFVFPLQTFFLRLMLPKKTALIIQHHGGIPLTGIKGYLYELLNSTADFFFFTTKKQGEELLKSKRKINRILPVMEGANHFVYQERSIARAITGMVGSIIFIWVGRLDDNKDPITVLDGFELIVEKYPTASLYMLYTDEMLLEKVKEKINASERLKQAVHLVGKIGHEKLAPYYNSADYFVLGSHYEGSGYALSEALACGCIPIVTAIPSFTMMTDEGKLGSLWKTGNSKSFVEAALTAMGKDMTYESKACVNFFKSNLSFDAIASTAIKYYQLAIDSRL